MTTKLTRPSWYRDEFYNKSRVPEEWLYELWKRYQFQLGEIGFPQPIHKLPMHEQERHFIEFVFDEKIEKLLNVLQAKSPQPIKYPTVSDIFIMYHQLINTDWYKNHPDRNIFESSISTITDKGTLSREEKKAFSEMQDIPWCVFYENHQQESWCPKREGEMEYLSGIPISLDPGYAKEDTITILKMKLNAWVGKLQGIQFQFSRWEEKKILAVSYLMCWFKLKRIEYTNIDLHRLIWPNGRGEINPYDDIDYCIELAHKVIDRSPISTLFSMCEVRKFKKEMVSA